MAKWYGIEPWKLMEREDRDFWIESAAVISNAEHDSMMKKQGK